MSLLLQWCKSFTHTPKKKLSTIDFPKVTLILNDAKPIVHVENACYREFCRMKMTTPFTQIPIVALAVTENLKITPYTLAIFFFFKKKKASKFIPLNKSEPFANCIILFLFYYIKGMSTSLNGKRHNCITACLLVWNSLWYATHLHPDGMRLQGWCEPFTRERDWAKWMV